MRVFIKVVNGEFISFVNELILQKEYPAFPAGFLLQATAEELAAFNCHEVFIDDQPVINNQEQNIRLGTPYLDVDIWRQSWEVTEKSDEEKRQARYNPDDFLLGLNQNSAYQTWSNLLPPNPYANFLLAVQRASESQNWVHVQSFYDGFKQAIPPPPEALIEWQEIADLYGILIVF